jgi:hypothetical protein
MFHTGAVFVILAIYMVIIGNAVLPVNLVFEIFGASFLIVAGIAIRLYKIEIRNFVLEQIIHICYSFLVIFVFGAVFNWYRILPVWFLIIMMAVIDTLSIIITINKIHKDTDEINELLKKRREENTEINLTGNQG